MADAVFTKRYRGKANSPTTWEAFIEIFNTVWGEKNHHLPKYPEVIGSIYASWEDGNAIYKVNTLKEIEDAYRQYKTASISISGNIDQLPKCQIYYVCKTAEFSIIGQSASEDKVKIMLKIVKKYFPIEFPDYCWLNEDSKTFIMKLPNIPYEIPLDFKMSNDTSNNSYYLFSILYDEWLRNKKAPIPLSNEELLKRLKKCPIFIGTLCRDDFIKTTVRNIRQKIEGKPPFKSIVSITNIRNKGYYLSINI